MSPPDASVSRRHFLGGASAAFVGAFASSAWPSGALARAPRQVGERAWHDLARRLSGRLLRPWTAGFRAAALPHNLRYAAVLPAGIARPRTADEVAQAIRWCREHDVPLIARAGGHSYAGYSTTHGLMIDVSPINNIELDRSTGLARVGGGARNGDLYKVLRAAGVAITHGRCSTVGAAGFLLGGGIGFNMRAHGIGCDQLIASEIVTADGRVAALGATENPDLLWACRGAGGGNFGINTSFTLQTFAVAPLTVFALTWTTRPEEVIRVLMRAFDAAPDRLGSRISLLAVTPRQRAAGKDVAVNVLGQLVGPASELRDILDAVYRIARPAKEEILEKSYWEGQDFLTETEQPTYFQERSTFIGGALDDRALALAFGWLRRWPGTAAAGDLRFFQTGGKVNAPAADATAFVHRSSRWIMLVGLYWDRTDAAGLVRRNRAWQDEFYAAMLPFGVGGAYQNFPDPSLRDWRTAYYGSNLPRLARIKAAFDPTNVFDFAQAVPAAGA